MKYKPLIDHIKGDLRNTSYASDRVHVKSAAHYAWVERTQKHCHLSFRVKL